MMKHGLETTKILLLFITYLDRHYQWEEQLVVYMEFVFFCCNQRWTASYQAQFLEIYLTQVYKIMQIPV